MAAPSAKPVRSKDNPTKELPAPGNGKGSSALGRVSRNGVLALPLRHWGKIAGVVAVLAVIGAAYAYWHYTTLHPSTDNAYVEANTVHVASAISGVVSEVAVKSFAPVKSGDVLVRIDQPRFEAQLKAAEARLAAVQQQKGNVAEAQAAVQQARAELDNATLKSPIDGILGKVSIQPGSLARAGVPIIPIVENANWWIDANFKETDLTRIRAGQKATVTIDIYPGHVFTGTVEAISPVSTNAFSLLPPENATGSWIKLTQRFPVHVSLTLKPDDPQMRLGASANVTVDTTD
jgi:membrane fusion protein (multidrug efflux system)